MGVSIATRQAYSEIDEFLDLVTDEQRNAIPKKLREFFKEEKDKEYTKHIYVDIPIKEQNLKEETLAIIAMLNLQYWCKDEAEKKRLQSIYAKNENLYQEKLREKYNPNNIFRKNVEDTKSNFTDSEENIQLIEYHESIITKIMNKILRFLKIK